MGVYHRLDSQWGGKLQTWNNYCCRRKTRWERGVTVWVSWRKYAAEVTKEKKDMRRSWWDIPQGQVVLETRLDLCHQLFPAEIRKSWTKWAGSWLLAFLFRVAHPCQAVFPARHWTFREREIRNQKMLGYLPGGLLSLVPQGPQANPGCPERDTHTFFQKTQWSIKKIPTPQAPAPLQQREEYFLRTELSPARSWHSCTNISEMFLLKPGLNLAPKNTWAVAASCGSEPCRPQCSAKYSISQLKSVSCCTHRGKVTCLEVMHGVKCFTGSGFKLLHWADKTSKSAAAGPHTFTPIPINPIPSLPISAWRYGPFYRKAPVELLLLWVTTKFMYWHEF